MNDFETWWENYINTPENPESSFSRKLCIRGDALELMKKAAKAAWEAKGATTARMGRVDLR